MHPRTKELDLTTFVNEVDAKTFLSSIKVEFLNQIIPEKFFSSLELKDTLEIEAKVEHQGSNSTVFKGSYKGKEVAVKQLGWKPSALKEITMTYYVHRLGATIPFIGIQSAPRHINLIMQWSKHGSLRQQLPLLGMRYWNEVEEKNPLGPAYEYLKENYLLFIAKKIALPLCNLLIRLHRNHLLHGDLLLDNILFTEENKVYLCDWGLARSTFDSRFDSLYAINAPEVYSGTYDTQSELWSFGMVLLSLYTLQEPEELLVEKLLSKDLSKLRQDQNKLKEELANSFDQVASVIQKKTDLAESIIPSDCPLFWREIIEACCQQDKNKRQNFHFIKTQLRKFIFSKGQAQWARLVSAWIENPNVENETHIVNFIIQARNIRLPLFWEGRLSLLTHAYHHRQIRAIDSLTKLVEAKKLLFMQAQPRWIFLVSQFVQDPTSENASLLVDSLQKTAPQIKLPQVWQNECGKRISILQLAYENRQFLLCDHLLKRPQSQKLIFWIILMSAWIEKNCTHSENLLRTFVTNAPTRLKLPLFWQKETGEKISLVRHTFNQKRFDLLHALIKRPESTAESKLMIDEVRKTNVTKVFSLRNLKS